MLYCTRMSCAGFLVTCHTHLARNSCKSNAMPSRSAAETHGLRPEHADNLVFRLLRTNEPTSKLFCRLCHIGGSAPPSNSPCTSAGEGWLMLLDMEIDPKPKDSESRHTCTQTKCKHIGWIVKQIDPKSSDLCQVRLFSSFWFFHIEMQKRRVHPLSCMCWQEFLQNQMKTRRLQVLARFDCKFFPLGVASRCMADLTLEVEYQ
jgi:hypothetical protein